jgi:CRISPR-associated protein Csb2
VLAVEVHFLTGRFVATAYNTRRASEWPPHPARLFSALVATHYDAEVPATDEHAALEWLERQPAPAIHASDASERDVVTVFVPVNDTTVVGSFEKHEAAIERAQAALAAARRSGPERAIRSAETALETAVTALCAIAGKATAAVAKITKDGPIRAKQLLPDYRGRQPRTFPSMTPREPRLTYIWADAEPVTEHRVALDRLLSRLVRLGHSSSLVSARLVDDPDPPTWRPATDGEITLRTVQRGQLGALDRAFAQHRETEPRVLPAAHQAYTRRFVFTESLVARSAFGDDWVVLRRIGGPPVPMVATAGVARAVRAALMRFSTDPLPELLTGHGPGGRPSDQPHLAVVPLSFVSHEHASGAILGVALVLPRVATQEDRAPIYRGLRAWEDSARQEDEDTPALPVHLGAAGVLMLERVEWGTVGKTLRATTWCNPSRIWLSAAPVALDRNPGDLRARDEAKLRVALGEAEQIISQACTRIGLPAPARVDFLPAAPLAGGSKAQHFPPFPEDRSKTRRVLTHVRVEFAEPVRGPVILGAGRYVGLGLMRPDDDRG